MYVLQNYINDKRYKEAHHTHLWQAMQDVANEKGIKDDRGNSLDVREILDTWLRQMGKVVFSVHS